MKAKILSSIIAVILIAATMLSLAGCSGCDDKQYFDNENDPLVFSTLEVDKVFNPFFSTSATDSNVVGMTQIAMLGNDKDGKPVWGDDEAVVAKDVYYETDMTRGEAGKGITTYYFVLKNNVKFSNGSPLTIKDVLFNLYVYLDPAYTGSSTIYSTDIVGLQAYRTQSATPEEQENFMKNFETTARARIDALEAAALEILEDNKNILTPDLFQSEIERYAREIPGYESVADDYEKVKELFRRELENDYTNSLDSYEDIKFLDEEGNLHAGLLTTNVEAFLYNEGYITWSKKDAALTYATGEDAKTWTKEQAIQWVYEANLPTEIYNVINFWQTATELFDYLTKQAMEEANAGATMAYPNISGIKFANRTQPVSVNGTQYAVPTYDAAGNVTSGNEVLTIEINGVDPKAIWNFGFAIAPMYYYSDEEHIAKFDYVSNFGVEFRSQTFMNTVVKNPDKLGVPVGAGPYAASKAAGGLENIQAGDFCSLGVIYFERNPHFIMGPAKIKKVRFQVVSNSQMLNTLYNGEIHWAEPNAKPETEAELNAKREEGIGNQSVQTSGYGYIGINAGKVPSMAVRQAIMHSINTQLCVDYYKTSASAIYRPMSLSSWAYPEKSTPYYPYIGGPVPENLEVVNPAYRAYCVELGKNTGDTFTTEEQAAFIKRLVEGAGYTVNANGVYQSANGESVLKYEFTVAGEETDHPAWTALYQAGEFLTTFCNFQITTKNDTNALKKLSTGDLTVWAAAWGSTIDPDMYQVYHKDSTASSTWNWGYRQIKANAGGKYSEELALVERLSDLIDEGRKTNDQAVRERVYAQALDIVMQLAVELPTYQRDDLFAYNANRIDESSLTPPEELSSYYGLTSEMHNVSLNIEQ